LPQESSKKPDAISIKNLGGGLSISSLFDETSR
jgi:hypothetical protein